mmetsp:Transcript_25184/g.54455  ORF Transcript_25184/g.54455 Transcript_25184/m.54455 type:complete len:352 (+) Transcript_25184:648-1703(+)
MGPQEAAGLAGLLCGADPDAPLLRTLNSDVFIQHVLDGRLVAHGSRVRPASLEVDALEGVGHHAVAEGDILHLGPAYGADDQAQAAAGDALEQHVRGRVLHGDAVVLVPDVAVVHVHVAAGEVQTVCIKGLQVEQRVAVDVGPARRHVCVAYHHAVTVLRPECPEGAVQQQQVLDQHVLGPVDVHQPGPVLLMLQEVDCAPPLLPIPVQSALAGRGEYDVLDAVQVDALHHVVPCVVQGPRRSVVREGESAVDHERYVNQSARLDPTNKGVGFVGNEKRVSWQQGVEGLVHQVAIGESSLVARIIGNSANGLEIDRCCAAGRHEGQGKEAQERAHRAKWGQRLWSGMCSHA